VSNQVTAGYGTAPEAAQAPGASADLLRALETVRDPELDEPITSLGFVASCTVSGDGDAQVRLRLPTYFCAPNFAFLMVADAYDAVAALPGVRRAEVITSPPTRSTAAWPPRPGSFGPLMARPSASCIRSVLTFCARR
jgi:metal-sulfur cluster biosynthetic enzyme